MRKEVAARGAPAGAASLGGAPRRCVSPPPTPARGPAPAARSSGPVRRRSASRWPCAATTCCAWSSGSRYELFSSNGMLLWPPRSAADGGVCPPLTPMTPVPEPGIVVEHCGCSPDRRSRNGRSWPGARRPGRARAHRCPRPSARRVPCPFASLRFASLLAQCLGLTVDGPRVVPPRVVCFALVVASFRLLA